MSGSSPKSISISGVETDITIGKELAAVAQKSKALASRDCFEQLEMYLHGRSHDRVCLLFGLLQTGKNTMLRQAIGRMTKEDLSRTAYIKARRTDNMAMMNRDLKKLFNAGFRYVFIDEVTLMEDFIDSAALFSDVFATMGMKIVLSGTDSLGFWLAMDEELYDRAKPIHTTFIPYREYSRLLGIDSIDEYIRYGGTLRAGELAFDDEDVNAQDASFRDDESTRRYIDTAICKNIQHSLACYGSGGHFRHLYSLYEAGELTSAINRIIEDMNHRFLISVLTDDFLSHDLRLTAANLRKERDPEKRTEALDAIDTEAVTRRLMELLDIRNKEEQSIGITTAHIIEIKQYLAALELIVDCPIESADPGIEPVEHILFTQPGMRYCQAQALVHSLLKDEQFSALSEYDKTQITGRILEEVRGRMMEDNKINITYQGHSYMLKFPPKPSRNRDMSYSNGCISEYVACHIFEMLGFRTQETLLGNYTDSRGKTKLVVACRDFTEGGKRLIEFAHLKNTCINSEQNGYGKELSSILEAIEEQSIYPSDELWQFFWDMFIADAFLGNFDRHNGNWGFLVDEEKQQAELAPVYDCGSCLEASSRAASKCFMFMYFLLPH